MDCAVILRMQDTEDVGPIDLRVAKDTNASSSLDNDWHAISQLPLPSPLRAASPLDIDMDYPWPSPPPPPPPPPCDKLQGSAVAGQKGSPEVQRERGGSISHLHHLPGEGELKLGSQKNHRPIRHCWWFCKMSGDLLQIIEHIVWWSDANFLWTQQSWGELLVGWKQVGGAPLISEGWRSVISYHLWGDPELKLGFTENYRDYDWWNKSNLLHFDVIFYRQL